jgi:adenylosuccinate lyase
MARLGLRSAPSSSQVVQRDRHAHYLSTIALIGASLEKIAVEVRHLQRTEVREAQEYFAIGQKGSSAMPHKRNPIVSEQISGLARILRSNALAGFENIALWHERDISHSSVERIIFPDSTIVLDYLLDKTANLVGCLVVYPDRMRENLEMMHGLVYSGQLLLKLVERGVTREDAYRWVQRNAMKAWDTGAGFRDGVLADEDITGAMEPADIEDVFESTRLIENVDRIFERVFGDSGATR